MLTTDSICLSHKEDPDGIISAALIKQLFDARIFLTDYNDLINTLQLITDAHKFKQIFICDLALKLSNIDQFFEFLSKINQNGAKIWFIDHHVLPEQLKKKFEELNVMILHSETDCTSAIIYDHFANKLKKNAELLAICACITDSKEDGVIAQKIIRKNDKIFTLLNSALIWYNIKKNQNNTKRLLKIVDSLTLGKLPFEITDSLDSFQDFLYDEFKLQNSIQNNTQHYNNFDCLKIHDGKLSNHVARMLPRSEKTICLVHRDFDNGSGQELVILSSKNNHKNIGLITNLLSSKFHGSGGGDPQRSAAIIPTENFRSFLESLDLELC